MFQLLIGFLLGLSPGILWLRIHKVLDMRKSVQNWMPRFGTLFLRPATLDVIFMGQQAFVVFSDAQEEQNDNFHEDSDT